MISEKEKFLIFIEESKKKLKKIDLTNNTFFNNELLEDPEIGGIFFAYYHTQFCNYLSMRKYEKDYFTAIYEKMVEIDKVCAIEEIFAWTYEVIDAEGDGNHYFNDINYITQLYQKNMEIIYLANEEVLFSQTFLEKAKESLYDKFSIKNHLYDIEERLLNAVKALLRADNLKNILSEDNITKERKRNKL